MKSVHAIQAEFEEWLAGKKHEPEFMRAVVYDQYGKDAWPVAGTRKEVLEQHAFYKDCCADLVLALACEEYYKEIKENRRF